jgi:hypothetical protein
VDNLLQGNTWKGQPSPVIQTYGNEANCNYPAKPAWF